jgi:hypothetical protein
VVGADAVPQRFGPEVAGHRRQRRDDVAIVGQAQRDPEVLDHQVD